MTSGAFFDLHVATKGFLSIGMGEANRQVWAEDGYHSPAVFFLGAGLFCWCHRLVLSGKLYLFYGVMIAIGMKSCFLFYSHHQQ